MSYRKVIELAAKLSSTYLSKRAVDIRPPAEPPELYWDAKMGFMRSFSVMEEDLMLLKHRGLSQSVEFRAMVKVREELLSLFKDIKQLHPHEGIRTLVAWVEQEKSNLLKLHHMIQKKFHEPLPNFPKHTAKGIPALLNFVDELSDTLNVEHAQLGSTVPPPRR